jgi:hypothetical protein
MRRFLYDGHRNLEMNSVYCPDVPTVWQFGK